jgi:hypothetical protein
MRTWGTPLKNPKKIGAWLPTMRYWSLQQRASILDEKKHMTHHMAIFLVVFSIVFFIYFYSTLNDHRNRPCTIEQLSSAHSSGFNCRPLQACFGPSENWMFQIMPEKYMLSPISWVPSVESQLKPRATEPRNLLGTPWVATGRPFAHRQRSCCTAPRAPDVLRDHPPAPWAPPVSWNVR